MTDVEKMMEELRGRVERLEKLALVPPETRTAGDCKAGDLIKIGDIAFEVLSTDYKSAEEESCVLCLAKEPIENRIF